MPQYHAGQKIEAMLEFVHGDRVGEVTATFVHADDLDTKLRLSGTPDQEVASEGAGYTYWRVVLSGNVTAEDKLGEYRCEAVEAEYSGGRKVAFGNVPEANFQIVEEDIMPPEVIGDWEWGASS